MGFVFMICVIGMVLISLWDKQRGVKTNGLDVDRSMFKMNPSFQVGALIVLGVLAALYTIFW
jgi:solute:Na+ symporter, SSS family